MPKKMTKLRDIPLSRLAAKVRQLALAGVTEIHCIRQDEDLWTIAVPASD